MQVLKDGYYISATIVIDPMGNVLQCSTRHDQSITLWHKDGNEIKLIHHWELERITGYKHHKVPFATVEDTIQFINELLEQYNIKYDDIVNVVGVPGFEKIANSSYFAPEVFDKHTFHPISHAFSCMLSDSETFYNNKILALACDGGPDYVLDTKAYIKDKYVAVYSEHGNVQFTSISSPGSYWAHFAHVAGMAEGSLMALAYASDSVSYEFDEYEIEQVFNSDSLKESHQGMVFLYNTIMDYNEEDIGKRFNYFDDRFTIFENKISMIMKVVQQVSIKQVDSTVKELLDKYNLIPETTILSLAGGYFLNCPTNTYLQQKYNFKDIIVMPAANDSGISIGIGLYYFYRHMDKLSFSYRSPFYGNSDDNLDSILKKYENYISSIHHGMEYFVDDIESSPIVWFNGRAEIGPRALGNRSILADPRKEESKKLLNLYKQRQWWRPVAPIVLEEYRSQWFEDSFYSPYMLHNFKAKNDSLTTIMHLDGTCRIQSITKEDNEELYNCVQAFHQKTGIPIICNTSLNDRGEPIIDNLEQAINFILRKGIKIAYLNGKRVVFFNHMDYTVSSIQKRYDYFFAKYMDDPDHVEKFNPYGFKEDEHHAYKTLPSMNTIAINSAEDAGYIKHIIRRIKVVNGTNYSG